MYIYTQCIYCWITDNCYECSSDISHTCTYCSLDNLKNLQDSELWCKKARNEIILFCYDKSVYLKDSMFQVFKNILKYIYIQLLIVLIKFLPHICTYMFTSMYKIHLLFSLHCS